MSNQSFSRKNLHSWLFSAVMPGDELGGYLVSNIYMLKSKDKKHTIHIIVGKVVKRRTPTKTRKIFSVHIFNYHTGKHIEKTFPNRVGVREFLNENFNL